jgi:hypothetical protein
MTGHATDLPPDAVSIYEELSELWGKGRFGDVEKRVVELREAFPGYIPGEVAYMVYRYQRGAQVEDLLSGLQWLKDTADRFPYLFSPYYRGILPQAIANATAEAKSYEEKGWDRDYRLNRYKPEKVGSGIFCPNAAILKDAPTVTIPLDGGQIVEYSRLATMPGDNPAQAENVVLDATKAKETRLRALEVLAARGDLRFLPVLETLLESDEWAYDSQFDLAISRGVGRFAAGNTDLICDVLSGMDKTTRMKHSTLDTMLMWALFRQADPSPRVMELLQSRTGDYSKNSAKVQQAAKEALAYLDDTSWASDVNVVNVVPQADQGDQFKAILAIAMMLVLVAGIAIVTLTKERRKRRSASPLEKSDRVEEDSR